MIGIDIISIERMERFMERFQERALERFLSTEEILLVKSPKTAAGFWAAKEAFSKALGTGIGKELGFHDMKICKNERGAPWIQIHEEVRSRYKIKESAITISHDGGFAVAAAMIVFH